ncbi:MAG: SMC-Scp complex subunit ScpB [bacterium]
MSLSSQIESILFVAVKPVSPFELVRILGAEIDAVNAAIIEIEKKYNQENSGLRLILHADKLSLGTAPESAEVVKKFLRADEHGELTRPALETLAVISYRGPVTKPEMEQIRGVNCALIIRNLLVRGLIEEIQNANGELTYQVTHAFLGHLGVTGVATLPEYETLRHHPDLERALSELKAVPENEGPKNVSLSSNL